jgi:hypothetical protein
MASIFYYANPDMKIFRFGCYLLVVIAVVQLTGHLILSHPQNPADEEMVHYLQTQVKHVAGGKMTLWDLQTGLNWCYALFFAGFGCLNLYLSHVMEPLVLKTVSRINTILFLLGILISLIWFFWFPVISFLVVALCFFFSAIRLKKST